MPVRWIALLALFLAVVLSVPPAGAVSPLKEMERDGDASLARGRHIEALRLYEHALEAGGAGRSDSTRLLAKRSKALRTVDQGILEQQRLSQTKGDHIHVLRLHNFEEADLHAEQLELIESSSRALISAGETEPVFTFLHESSCRDSACGALRARLWRALASSSSISTGANLPPGQYWPMVERYDSLAAYAPEAPALKQTLERRRALASAFHSGRAAELAPLAGSAYFHHRMAAQYGAPATSASRNAERAIEALAALEWRMATADGPAACPDFVRRVEAAFPMGGGQPVSVELRLDRCEPGRDSWAEEEECTYTETVMRSKLVYDPPGSFTQSDGTVVVRPGSTRAVQEPVEVPRVGRREVSREGDTYFARGTATLSWGAERRSVELDLHPRFSDKTRPGEMMETVARNATDLLLDAGAQMAARRANDGVLRALRAETAGQSDIAENEYVIAVRLLGKVPEPAQQFFARQYGLRGDDVKRCILGN